MISMDLTWEEIVYGNGMFVAISGTNNNRIHIAYSADGINWNLANDNVNNGGYSTIVYGNGQYIVCGSPQKFVYSYDGIVWYDSVPYISQNNTDITADTLAALKHTHYEYQHTITGTAGQFVVIGDDGNVTTKTISYAEEASF